MQLKSQVARLTVADLSKRLIALMQLYSYTYMQEAACSPGATPIHRGASYMHVSILVDNKIAFDYHVSVISHLKTVRTIKAYLVQDKPSHMPFVAIPRSFLEIASMSTLPDCFFRQQYELILIESNCPLYWTQHDFGFNCSWNRVYCCCSHLPSTVRGA